MKKIIFSILIILTGAVNAMAAQVGETAARKAGLNFLLHSTRTLHKDVSLDLVFTAASSDAASGTSVPYFYVFNHSNKGFVIIAADDKVEPVLGYSDEGNFPAENIPAPVKKWLDEYSEQIQYAIGQDVPPTEAITQHWQELLTGTARPENKAVQAINPLVQTKWNQSPYENILCPYDYSVNQRTVTGCPATAMAQIMKYWNYPATGSGFHSYNHQSYGTLSANFGSTSYQWNAMPNILTSANTPVSTLMYHCGVAVEMDYGVDASGSYVIVAASPSVEQTCENAYKTFFGYNPSTLQGLKRAGYSDASWINLMKTELNASRPIQYAGFGSGGGHTFVCDGYDNNNFFHMNWGWGGSSDGYFILNALNPGSLGTGGGSGGFNSNQQALIGIQPLNNGGGGGGGGNQNIDMQLYSGITMPSSQIWFTTGFSLSVDIANYGSGTFSGQFGAAIFDQNNNFVDFMEVKSNMTLNPNSHYTNPLTFSHPGSAAFVPGDYYVAMFYKTATQDWTIIGNGNYSNYKAFEIYYSAAIEPFSAFTITSNAGKLIQGQNATVNIDVTNTAPSTFYGSFRVNLSNLDGTWVQNIQILNENTGLPEDYHYTGGLNFTGIITAPPGTYLMELAYQAQGTSTWYYAGSTNFSNPVYVIVEAAALSADQYENNNSVQNAFNLPIAFSGNTASKNTSGSTLHLGTDNDFYKISLPAGFNYSVTARLHDSYNSGNGNTYSADALFSYSSNNGAVWSDNYDDVMPGNIPVSNGGTIFFRVAPYFAGGTGTYLLDLNITRTVFNSVAGELEALDQVSLFPNPAVEFISLSLPEKARQVNEVHLLNFLGQRISSHPVHPSANNIRIPLSGLANGIYFVEMQVSGAVVRKKLMKAE